MQYDIGVLSTCQEEYQRALAIVEQLNIRIRYHEYAYKPEQLQPGEIGDRNGKEADRMFQNIRIQNPEYKRIMDKIAYQLFVEHDDHLDDLYLSFDSKVERLNKEQLIYYINMCWHLSQNPQYVEYMSQIQLEQTPQGVHR